MSILLSPPVAFLIILMLCYLLYLAAAALAPKLKNTGGKLKSYACGEDMPGKKIQFGYETFFLFAIFFTMMHVAALVIATIPSGMIVFFGVFYLFMIFISVLALVIRG